MKKIIVSLMLLSLLLGVEAQARLFESVETANKLLSQNQSSNLPLVKNIANHVYKIYYLKYADAAEVEKAIKPLLSSADRVSVAKTSNALILSVLSSNLNKIEAMIKTIDRAPKQVLVKAKIVEFKYTQGDNTNPSSLGFGFKYSKNSDVIETKNLAGRSSDTNALGVYGQLLAGDTEAYLSALDKKTNYNILASPWVTAINHREAKILIGSKYGYSTSTTTQTTTVQEVSYLEVGTKLTFTPHINDDGYILMDIYPVISEGQVSSGLPQENTTETSNRVLVKDGQTIVIGGLTKDGTTQTESGIPILMNIPLLGTFFRKTEIVSEKREIMVFLTPHIITPEFLDEMADTAKAMEDAQKKNSGGKLIH